MTILFDKQWKMDEKEKTAAIAEVPEEFRETYACLLDEWEALNMQEVLRLSEILEDSGADETFWAFQKATAYLDMDLPKQAECCIDELNSVYPDNPAILLIKAICRQQNGDVYQAERLLESIYPPEEYNPFYYSVYGSVLEEREKRTAAYEQYRVAYEHFRDGYPSNEIFMDGIFQRMIELDMALELDMVEEDVDAYIAFLKGIKNTEEWQCQVNENLMLFAQYMSAEKNREPLCRLVNNLLDSGFMTSAIRLRELRLLARSPEVCAMIGDPKISKFTLELVEQTVLIGSMEDREADETMDMESDAAEELWDAQTEAAMLKYYAVKRLPGILDEFEYIRSAYPHIYETLADFAGELREDPVKTASKYREIFRERTGEEKITASSLDRFYKETYESGNVIWSSDDGSYVRTEKKVGRNDPCPCGSGKKYKRCCGRK